MKINKLTGKDSPVLSKIMNIYNPPNSLYYAGSSLESYIDIPALTVVGSRKVSPYGRMVTENIVGKVAALGLVIVSGLAYGIDSIAHQSALAKGGMTIAVLPSPLDNVVPVINRKLADKIISSGGTLISEYPPGQPIHKQNFIARNRIMATLGDALLITEAAEKSGSLHTARFALEQGKTILVVPGDINRNTYIGCNNLIKQGATIVTSHQDVLNVFGMKDSAKQALIKGRNDTEQKIIDLIRSGVTDANDILEIGKIEVSNFNVSLTMLEIDGKIRPLGGNQWSLA